MSTVTNLDSRSVRITMSVIGYLGVNEFYRKVDKFIQSNPDASYEDALHAVVSQSYDRINRLQEAL